MTLVFHCYEFLLLKKLDEDPTFWDYVQEIFAKEKDQQRPFKIQTLPSDLWFLAITLEKTRDRFPSFVRDLAARGATSTSSLNDSTRCLCSVSPQNSLLTRYLNSYDFVELHLDSIFKYGEGGQLPLQLFKCSNLRALSLKYNFLEVLPSDIGRLEKLEYLALTNNRLQNSSIPRTLAFCGKMRVLFLDNNLLDALPGFLLTMPSLQTVHRHGNHNYFKATFMWYHTDFNDRILAIESSSQSQALHPPVANPGSSDEESSPTQPSTSQSSSSSPSSLQLLSAQSVIAAKLNFFNPNSGLPPILKDFIAQLYHKFNICGNCPKARPQYMSGYKVFTFKNPYLGNTCVPFQHWACCLECAEAIEIPARIEQMLSSLEQDRQYNRYVRQAQQEKYFCSTSSSSHPFCSPSSSLSSPSSSSTSSSTSTFPNSSSGHSGNSHHHQAAAIAASSHPSLYQHPSHHNNAHHHNNANSSTGTCNLL